MTPAPITLLIADDDPAVRRVIERALAGPGRKIVCAEDGLKALAAARMLLPAAIVLDVNMPGMDGRAVCAALRGDCLTRHLSILMLSQRRADSDELSGLDAGADEYVGKPFNIANLRARIDVLLRHADERLGRHPLTGLPGSGAIESEVAARLAVGTWFSFCYVDVRRFKSVNDTSGFHIGNEVIRRLAQTLGQAAAAVPRGFVGHIGGDDFVLIGDHAPDQEALRADFAARTAPLFDHAPAAPPLLTIGHVRACAAACDGFAAVAAAASRAKECGKIALPAPCLAARGMQAAWRTL